MQEDLNNIRKQQLGLVAVSYDSPAVLKTFAERKNITFPLLSDTESKTIRAYGILNSTIPADSPYHGVPYPGTFILNPAGVVTAKYFEDDYKERYTSSAILLRQFGAEAGTPYTAVETKHLRLATSQGTTVVRTGQRVSLTLDIDLKPRMHVYAPGVEGYIPIDWKLTESPAFKPHDSVYPESKKVRLEVIKETVPVYQGHFRVVREVTIGSDAQVKPALNDKGELVIAGTFRYQACDDKICYIPETVPVTWTLRFETMDRQRAPAELQRKR